MNQKQLAHRLRLLVREAIENGRVPEQKIQRVVKDIFEYRKVCTICERMLPGDHKHFAAHKHTRDGFQLYCRDCGNRMNAERERKPVAITDDFVEELKGLDFHENIAELDYRELK